MNPENATVTPRDRAIANLDLALTKLGDIKAQGQHLVDLHYVFERLQLAKAQLEAGQ